MAILVIQALFVIMVLLTLFALRSQIGRVPLYVFVGTLQVLQTLGAAVFVPVTAGLLISPGSAVMFTVGLVAVLLVYIRDDAIEARRLIYALLLANSASGVLLLLLSMQIEQSTTINYLSMGHNGLVESGSVLIFGTVLLVIDALLVVVRYETYASWLRHALPAMLLTLWTVSILDSALFASFAFRGDPELVLIIGNSALAKCLVATFYVLLAWAYLRFLERDRDEVFAVNLPRDVFAILSYRQKYELARKRAIRDGLTGVFNRAYFEVTAPHDLKLAIRRKEPLSLLLVDLDHFKKVNDELGHARGDQVLKAAAQRLARGLRGGDYVCRFGGEEFAVILPDTALRDAHQVGEKLGAELRSLHALGLTPVMVTASIGVSGFPDDGCELEGLVEAADRRLYQAKRSGRARVESVDDIA